MPALRMKSGVGWSGSPTQKVGRSERPCPAFTSSRILEAVSTRTAARAAKEAAAGGGVGVSLFMQASILDSGKMKKEQWALAAAVGTMVAWGMNFAFVKYILDHLGVGAFMFLRFSVLPLLGFALLAIAFRGRLARTWPKRADLPRFVVCALVGHIVHISAVMYGMNLSTAFSSSLVLTSQPLFTLGILTMIGAERLRPRQILGTLVAFAGIVLFLADKFAGGLSRAGTGDLTLLIAGVAVSSYTAPSAPLAACYGPLNVRSHTPLLSPPPMLVVT